MVACSEDSEFNDFSNNMNSKKEEFTFDCKKCKGTGQVYAVEYVECSECDGRRKKCGSCNGSGRTSMFGGWICTLCMGDGKASSYCSCYSGKTRVDGQKICPQCNGRGKISL